MSSLGRFPIATDINLGGHCIRELLRPDGRAAAGAAGPGVGVDDGEQLAVAATAVNPS